MNLANLMKFMPKWKAAQIAARKYLRQTRYVYRHPFCGGRSACKPARRVLQPDGKVAYIPR